MVMMEASREGPERSRREEPVVVPIPITKPSSAKTETARSMPQNENRQMESMLQEKKPETIKMEQDAR